MLENYTLYTPDKLPEFSLQLTERQWRKVLTAKQYGVLRGKATERAFSGEYYTNHSKGVYYSAASAQALFSSDAKFDSGSGWPSFYKPVSPEAVVLAEDKSHGMSRIEVLDSSSGSHLGHVFTDGPKPTGLRFCINSAALVFVAEGNAPPKPPTAEN